MLSRLIAMIIFVAIGSIPAAITFNAIPDIEHNAKTFWFIVMAFAGSVSLGLDLIRWFSKAILWLCGEL